MRLALLISLILCVAIWVLPHNADAAKKPHYACATIQACRNELAHKDARVAWLKHKAAADVARVAEHSWPGDAIAGIILAAHRLHASYLVPSALTVGSCESHLDPLAHNGTHLGLFQLSAWHRSDPAIRLLGWRDPYAQAIHTLGFAKRHGWGQWECRTNGTVVHLG